MRKISYAEAIKEATDQMMGRDEKIFIIGQGCTSPWYVGTTTAGLLEKYGEKRVIDTPVSEAAVTGIGVGAAVAGMRPIIIHPRMDFMFYAMDAIVNEAANWYYMTGGRVSVPIVFRGIINRGGEQAAQHSQALQALFAHIPGLKVVMPATPYDAKGLLISAVYDGNPVVYIDDRWLYEEISEVPKEMYKVPIGKAVIKKEGKDVTITTTSFMLKESLKAAKDLEREGIGVEVVDLRTIKPLDEELIFNSLKKTGRLVVADATWRSGGVSAEILARVSESLTGFMKAPIKRVCLPDCPAPMSRVLEKAYYPTREDIIKAVKEITR